MPKKLFGLVVLAVVIVGVVGFVKGLTSNAVELGYNQGYEPDQPIDFSHELHAGKNKIACQYCHTTTEVSRHASVPSLNICMNCHLSVKTDDKNINKKEIEKLTSSFYANKPIQWQKVHLLPDHVKFNHSAHVRAGKSCQTCHGPVETMKKVYQYNSLSMGWCVNCHRKPENKASTNCGTCHY